MNQARYEFQNLIATGGMGEVWRATDTMLGRDVAVKLLKPEFADDPVNRSRFDSEARHAAALHHPHVAAVYDVGEMPTASGLMRPYLVMEFVDGKPLSDLVKDGRPLDPAVVRDLLGQAGDALTAAHQAGIVHRDVKPANLLVTPDGNVKVTDFGIARAGSSGAITGTGQVMGTPQYLSPEQARGERATPASDVYSLGVVAFECLTGHRPFQKETPVATAIAHLHDPVPPLPDTVPPDLANVVTRALSKDASQRYPDAAGFTEALRNATAGAAGMPGTAATEVIPPAATMVGDPVGQTSMIPTAEPSPEELDEYPEDDDGKRKKSTIILIILGVLALLAVLAMIWFFFIRDSDPPPADNDPSPTPTPTRTQSEQTTEPTDDPTTEEPETIDLNPNDYIGRPVDDVIAQLRDMGLQTNAQAVDNPGDKTADTVSGLEPTRGLTPGATVTVSYWGIAPTEEPEPSVTPSEEPSEDEPTGETSDAPTETTSPSALLSESRTSRRSGEGRQL